MVIEELVRLTSQKLTQQRANVSESQKKFHLQEIKRGPAQLPACMIVEAGCLVQLDYYVSQNNFNIWTGYISGYIKMFNRRFVRPNLTLISEIDLVKNKLHIGL